MANGRALLHLHLIVAATVTVAASACGGGSGGPAPGDGGGLPGSGQMAWLDDGARKTAVYPTAALVRSSMVDLLQVTGSTNGGAAAVSFGVTVTPPIAPGTIVCGAAQRPFASISYLPGTDPLASTCSVTLSTVVLGGTPHVTGTFEAVFPKTGGGTKTISDGTFDLAMTVSAI